MNIAKSFHAGSFASLCVTLLLSAFPTLVSGQLIGIGTTAQYHNHRFEYWGTSLAWWANEVGGQTNAQGREDLVDIFFDPLNGLGMNFVRYNIGAGSPLDANGNPDTSNQNITRPGAVMDGWVPQKPSDYADTSTWVWDWNADATQRLILDMAIEHGVTTVEAFANSAPWWLTRNEQSNGNGGSNLSTARNDEFAHYMLEVVDHFATNLGIHFETLAPMNEPGSGFWSGNSNQEGMGVPAGFYQDRMIKEFGSSIEDRGVNIKLVGLEETSTDQSGDSWSNASLTNAAKAYIDQFNTHSYGFNGASLKSDSERLFDLVSADNLKIYATEYGTGQGAVRLATQINRDIRYLDAAGWTYWQAIEDNNGSGWGLSISNFNGNNPRFDVQDQYFGFKQFSAHIRPGSEIIELAGQEENITAAYDPRTGTTAVVVTNDGSDGTSETYNFSMLDRQALSTRLIRTTDENNSNLTNAYQSLGPAQVNSTTVSFDAIGNSITTLVIHHRENLISNGNFDPNGLPDNSPQFDDWQSDGDAVFDTGADISGDGSGSAQLRTDTSGNSGKIYQTGIGDPDTDLTGVAYQLSADVQFRNAGNSEYDADTFLALEFYGADDETLASVSLNETEIEPAFAVKPDGNNGSVVGSDPNDSVYRNYVSGRFVAPEGTRYVRPVVRFDGVTSGSNSMVSLDNIRLQEVHPEAAAREWNGEGGGAWSNNDNWLNNANVENNQRVYLGNAINGISLITIDSVELVEQLTLFSDHTYILLGSGTLRVGTTSSSNRGLIDVREGTHVISADAELWSNVDIQVLPDSTLTVNSVLKLNGQQLTKLGAGALNLQGGLDMNNGLIAAYATSNANFSVGANSVLDGSFELRLSPGQNVQAGDTFELLTYSGLGDTFDNLVLPALDSGLSWDVDYGATALTAEVITSLPGDFNRDGFVDAADFTHWRDNLGEPDFVLNGNGDGLSVVDTNDYVLWLINFGNTAASNALVSVPEPEGCLYWLAFISIFVAARKKLPRKME